MPADDQLPSEHPSFGDERSGPYGRHQHRHHHHHHQHSRHRLRQKAKNATLIGMALVLALLVWYLLMAYLDDRAVGPQSHRRSEMLYASGSGR